MSMESEILVPRWEPHDFALASATAHDNPFAVPFSAVVQTPESGTFVAEGFYDGDGTCKVRIAPYAEGVWTLTTRSTDPALDGRTVTFRCVPQTNPNVHGGLRVDPERPHYFLWEDGSRYFLCGYECDWLWALDMDNPKLPTLVPFLDKLAAHGFNQILLNAYAHDCDWRRGRTGNDDYGPPPMFAWQGTNEHPDHSRFNLAFWRHYDLMMEALYRRGIVAHVMIKVYNKMVNWPAKGSSLDDLYFRWVVARYAAFSNVVWSFSKESNNEPDLAYKIERCRFVRRHDPYRRLITTHDDEAVYNSGAYNDVLDFHSDQHHSNWRVETLRKRRENAWPVVNVEFGYEHGPGGVKDWTYAVVQPPKELCRRAWEICTAGGYVVYYYTYTAWDVIRPEDTPPGYAYFRNLRKFFEKTGYWLMEPTEGLASMGYCLADPGREYVVFLDRAASFTLALAGLEAPLPVRWYNPFTGRWRDAGTFGEGTLQLVPPADWGAGPVALHVGEKPAA